MPRAGYDLDWLRVDERLRLIGSWAQATMEDLRWRTAAVGRAGELTAGMATATLVFPDPVSAVRATTADVEAIAAIVDRKPFRVGGVTHVRPEDIADMAAWLERTAGRASDTAYAATVVDRLGPDGAGEALDLAAQAGPVALARMGELIAAATRSGGLDDKVAEALLDHPHLRFLAEGKARLSPGFAQRATDALLDPDRVAGADPLEARPHPDDLEAARHLMEAYGTGPGTEPALLADLAGRLPLSAGLVAELIRLAVISETDRAGSEQTLGAVLRGLGPASGESKRALAEGVVAHMEAVAVTIDYGDVGDDDRVKTQAALHTLMGDRQARQTIIDGAAAFAGEQFGSVTSALARTMAAHPGMSPEQAFAAMSDDNVVMRQAGGLLRTLAEWPGGRPPRSPPCSPRGSGCSSPGRGWSPPAAG